MVTMIIGIFPNREKAEEVIIALEKEGYNPKKISFIMKDVTQAKAISENTGASIAGTGALGLLARSGVVADVTAKISPKIVTRIITGELVRALAGMGVPERTARFYEDKINAGGVLLAVPADVNRYKVNTKSIIEKTNQIRQVSISQINQKYNPAIA